MIKITLNGKEIEARKGMTILEVAKEYGIKIPTLCHDEELKPYGSCWVCSVKVEGKKGFVTSCGTTIEPNMVITTDSEEIHNARRMALELLLSDHYADCEAPCKLACPGQVDVQSYVALIANNQQHEAVKVIKDTLPMPLSIGRVCPAFCEKECRRTIVDEPIAIRQLKRYAADSDLNDYWSYVHPQDDLKGKHIAIVGAGPSGLTCGYYLSQKGYEVTVFEASPKPGGWLYYGIPEYRLPKEILEREIELMCSNGMVIETEKILGKDFTLPELSNKYDAVYLAIGAQKAVPMHVKGSDLPGSYLGVDYLKDIMLGKEIKTGKKVAVIGGGNTAIDCARTARRLGAEVTIIYRRTRKEMPAEPYEIVAAEEEGIKLHILSSPVEYIGDEKGIRSVRIEKMRLGAPDSSGRQRPEPTGEYEIELFDTVIAAISQVPEVELFSDPSNRIDGKNIPISRWSTVEVDEELLFTGLKNVFAGGDFRLGPSTAIEAIADGRRAAENIAVFLQNGCINDKLRPKKPFQSRKAKSLKETEKFWYSTFRKEDRVQMPELDAEMRIDNFEEVEIGFSEDEAIKEAERCLECGCMVNYRCSLRDYATDYDVGDTLFFGTKNQYFEDISHPFILRDANKCIDCGLCVRTCSEIQGPGVLGYINRGFVTVVKPEFGESLTKTACESCGKCVTVCPTGALTENNTVIKMYPLEDTVVDQNCGFCGTGCKISIRLSLGNIAYITHPETLDFNLKNICFYGKFGWEVLHHDYRVNEPMLKTEYGWAKIDWRRAASILKDKLDKAKNKVVTVSPHNTNEELLLMKEIAERLDVKLSTTTCEKIFTDDFLSEYANNLSFKSIKDAEHIVIVGETSQTIRVLCRSQQLKGKKMTLINKNDKKFNKFANHLFKTDNLSSVLQEMKQFALSGDDTAISAQISNLTNAPFTLPQKTVFIYNRNKISEKEIYDIWSLALSVCDFGQGSGVLETSDWSNINALRLLDIEFNPELPLENTFVLNCGERLIQKLDVEKGNYTVAIDTHYTDDYPADLILPKPSYLKMEGTSLSDDNRLNHYYNPEKSPIFPTLLQILYESGLITIEKTEPSVWLAKTEKFFLKAMPSKVLDSEKIKLPLSSNELSDEVNIATEYVWHYLHQAEEKRKVDQTEV